jgi:hypothetical protein
MIEEASSFTGLLREPLFYAFFDGITCGAIVTKVIGNGDAPLGYH